MGQLLNELLYQYYLNSQQSYGLTDLFVSDGMEILKTVTIVLYSKVSDSKKIKILMDADELSCPLHQISK